jgi:hypothetical protein
MSWRNHETHKEETKAVKAALKEAGIKAKVKHGTGTAWAWLEINTGGFNEQPDNKRYNAMCVINNEVRQIVRAVTGRTGQHDGEILLLNQSTWNHRRRCHEEIVQDPEVLEKLLKEWKF